jgi:hypothetical protein
MFSIKDQACIVGVGQTPFSRGSTEEPNNLTIQPRAAEAVPTRRYLSVISTRGRRAAPAREWRWSSGSGSGVVFELERGVIDE